MLPSRRLPMRSSTLLFGLCACISFTAAREKPLPVTYYSRAAPGYEREIGPDGKPKVEHYALSYGGRVDGTTWSEGMNQENFPKIAGVVAEQLAKQNYFYAPDATSANLLLVIHWGQTLPFNAGNFTDSVNNLGTAMTNLQAAQAVPPPPVPTTQEAAAGASEQAAAQQVDVQIAAAALESSLVGMDMENRVRDRRGEEIARVLGYVDEMRRMSDLGGFTGEDRFITLRNEVEDPRYYIVLTAYDFVKATQKGKREVLWTSRISIDTRGNNFMDRMEQMVARAANSFGQNTNRLVRERTGEVEIGEAIVLDPDVDKNRPAP